MPTNKNALTRIALLDKLLADRYHAYSITDLTEVLNQKLVEYGVSDGVTRRCVEKDIAYLEFESPFNVEMERYYIDSANSAGQYFRKKCIRYADADFSIFKQKLKESDISILSSAVENLSAYDGLPHSEWLADLRHLLKLEEQHSIIQLSKNLNEYPLIISTLFKAIAHKAAVKLEYQKFSDKESYKVVVSPYILKEHNSRWFLIAQRHNPECILTYAVDRIKSVEVALEDSYFSEPPELRERYEDIIGVTYVEYEPIQKITFWASDYVKPYLLSKPIHGSQKIIRGERETILRAKHPFLTGGTFISIDCKVNPELIRELTNRGADLIVVSPQSIVEKIRELLSKMNDTYNLI